VQWQQIKKDLAYSDGGTEQIDTFGAITATDIMITHTVGSFTGGTSPSYRANSLIRRVKLHVGTDTYVDLGTNYMGGTYETFGMAVLRESMKTRNQVTPSDETWHIRLPAAIDMRNATLEIEFAELSTIASGGPTAYDGTIDVHVASLAGPGARPHYTEQRLQLETHNGTQNVFLPPSTSGTQVAALWMAWEVDDALTNSPFANLLIKVGTTSVFDGPLALLRYDVEQGKHVSLRDGFALLELASPVPANTIQFQIKWGTTASSSRYLHLVYMEVK